MIHDVINNKQRKSVGEFGWWRHYTSPLRERKSEKEVEVGETMWKQPPVDFITFCRDWIKEPLFEGPQEEFASDVMGIPSNKEMWNVQFKTILLAWGKGSGKGSLSAKLLVYVGYLLLNMKNPREFFGIGKTAPIHMVNVSYNSFQAKTVFFQGYLIPTVLNTINPQTGKNFFRESGMDLRVNEGDILSNMIHFERPKQENEGGITAVSLAGDRGTAEGFSPLIIFVDEYSAMQSPLKAEKLVDDLENSALSRFKKYYKLIIASFKQGRNCLMSMRVAAAEEKNFPDVYVSKKATWEVNRIKKQEDFAEIYERNPVKSARTFEFKEVEGVDENVFFRLVDRLRDAFVSPDHNPFVGDVVVCRTDQLKILEFKPWFRPDTSITYYLHIDLAKGTAKDRAGFCICRKEGLESFSSTDLQKYIAGEYVDKEFRVKAIIVLQLIASKDGQIILDEIRQFIVKLSDWGFKLEVTLDGYNSLDFIQILNSKNIKAELLSVDRDKKAYDSLQSLIYRRNIDIYEHPVLFRELEELEESADGKKVDHPQYSLRRQKTEDNINAGCFTGETLIPLVDGRVLPIGELDGKEIQVFSCDTKGVIKIGNARGRFTKKVSELILVTLDNKRTIRCTPNHLFMLRNGCYKAARDLIPFDDRLMPINRYEENGGYEVVGNKIGKRRFVHYMVLEERGFVISPKQVVHHINGNKKDNRFENLAVMSKSEHSKLHTEERHRSDPEYKMKVLQGLNNFNNSEKGKNKHSAAIRRTVDSFTKEELIARARNNPNFRKDVSIDRIIELLNDYRLGIRRNKGSIVPIEKITADTIAKNIPCDRKVVLRIITDSGFNSWFEFVHKSMDTNHKVISVETILLGDPVKVYDLEVDQWDNFLLDAGVVVHNSKDVADALAGAALKAMLAPSASIPLMPQMQKSYHPKQAQYDEEDEFENSMMGGLVSMDKAKNYDSRDKKKATMFVPLFPTRG